jgi:uncharacterized protein
VTWFTYDARQLRLTLTVHVQPNARRTGFAGLHGDALKVRIGAPAVDNKANAALVALLSVALDVPASMIAVMHGGHSRRKVVAIQPATSALAARAKTLPQTE